MAVVVQAPSFRFTKAVTPSDTADNCANSVGLHNSGSSGAVPVIYKNSATGTLYINQGDFILCDVARVKSTGLGAGVTILALY